MENEKVYFSGIVDKIMTGEKALSYSSLSKFLKSPKHFREYYTEKEVTKAMEEGKMFHMACLQPEEFEKKYWVLDDTEKCVEIGGAKPRSTKKYKEWIIEEDLKHSGQERISQEDYDKFMRMSNALRYNKASSKFMRNQTTVESFFNEDLHDFKVCGFIDLEGEDKDGKYIVDLKKVADASFKKCKWNIDDMNYDLQGGLYAKVKSVSRYYLIFIDAGCNITIVKLLPETLERGVNKLFAAMDGIQECAETDNWSASYEFFNGGIINY